MAALYCQKEDAVYGRGLYATRRVPASSRVLMEVPVVHVVTMAHKACQFSLSKPQDTPLLGCAGCQKRVWYCGKDCQTKDWPFHREECKAMAELESMGERSNFTEISDLNLLEHDMSSIRLLVRAVCTKDLVINISSLVHEDPVRRESVIRYILLADTMVVRKRHGHGIADILKEKYGNVVSSDAMVETICSRIMSSYFSIHNYNYKVGQQFGTSIGKGIYPQCCMLNHSCEPNCLWVSDGRSMVVRTVRDVAAGEQFFIGYVNPYDLEKHNKAFMSQHFGFVPSCKHCDLPEKYLKSDRDHLARVNLLYNAQDWQAVVDYSGSIKSTLAIVRITEIQLNAYHKLDNYKEALKCAQKVVDLTRDLPDSSQWLSWWNLFHAHYFIWKSSPDVLLIHDELLELMGHPYDHHFDGIAVHMERKGVSLEAALRTLKKALEKRSPFMAAVSALKEAVKVAEMSHGSNHSLTKECDDLLSHTQQFVQEVLPLIQRAILRKKLKSSSIILLTTS